MTTSTLLGSVPTTTYQMADALVAHIVRASPTTHEDIADADRLSDRLHWNTILRRGLGIGSIIQTARFLQSAGALTLTPQRAVPTIRVGTDCVPKRPPPKRLIDD